MLCTCMNSKRNSKALISPIRLKIPAPHKSLIRLRILWIRSQLQRIYLQQHRQARYQPQPQLGLWKASPLRCLRAKITPLDTEECTVTHRRMLLLEQQMDLLASLVLGLCLLVLSLSNSNRNLSRRAVQLANSSKPELLGKVVVLSLCSNKGNSNPRVVFMELRQQPGLMLVHQGPIPVLLAPLVPLLVLPQLVTMLLMQQVLFHQGCLALCHTTQLFSMDNNTTRWVSLMLAVGMVTDMAPNLAAQFRVDLLTSK
mmetsp:Transcript_11625/g.16130  ORF Transcript_11625/g.16130 Transcript_11625/m.16130 type:complete len:256 (-) Transcript_11625:924-1691(-)